MLLTKKEEIKTWRQEDIYTNICHVILERVFSQLKSITAGTNKWEELMFYVYWIGRYVF